MKNGRTHLAHKAEQAVDLETGAIVAVTVQDADEGDTTTSIETLIEAAKQVFAHLYETGGRLLIHAGGFNLGLLMRQLIRVGTPRGLQGRVAAVLVALLTLIRTLSDAITCRQSPARLISRFDRLSIASTPFAQIGELKLAFTTGCWIRAARARKAATSRLTSMG